jgi:F420-non-reducing hydrogenase iron-sulfur subunit
MPETNDFEPDITAFACIYCAYTAADIAGATHTEYPANVKVIKLPCTGRRGWLGGAPTAVKG